jgi:hypothetical protein
VACASEGEASVGKSHTCVEIVGGVGNQDGGTLDSTRLDLPRAPLYFCILYLYHNLLYRPCLS